MNLALWLATGLLAAAALAGGIVKTFVPMDKLTTTTGAEWTSHFPTWFVRSLGVLEILAAAGLVLPAVVGVAPVLVPVTAVCWVGLMVGAMVTHLRYDGVALFVAMNVVYLLVAAFIAWGRFWIEPLQG